MSNEQDLRAMTEAVARWMGWTVIKKGAFSILWQPPPHNDYPTIDLPDYAASLEAMREVEHEIERRGLWEAYTWKLIGVVFGGEVSLGGALEWWQISRATAAQRLEAAYRVIQGEAASGKA